MKTKKKVFITGITGQDGAYLTEFLLSKGYDVWGLQRRASMPNTQRIDHLMNKIQLVYGDMTDSSNLIRLIKEIEPDEIYNLAAQSDVHVSFDTPEHTANTDAIGTLRILEAIRICGFQGKTKFYQASTSELYGQAQQVPQNETTPFRPRSPYAAAKLYAYWITVNYREAYGIYACNGILFNHESPLRGEEFVTKKITKAAVAIKRKTQSSLSLGNLDAKRDWGHARDYVAGMWAMMQQDIPDDYVLATGETHTVREFVEMAFAHVGIYIEWKGRGESEIGVDKNSGQTIISVDPQFYRPTEVDMLVGDATKAKQKLGWVHSTSLKQLVAEMMEYDLKNT